MESPTPASPRAHAVEVAPSARRQLGHLSNQDYGVLQQRLTALAMLASEGRLPDPRRIHGAGVDTALSLTAGTSSSIRWTRCGPPSG